MVSILCQAAIVFVYCELSLDILFAGVPMNWVRTLWLIDWTGNCQRQVPYPHEFRYVIFSFPCTLPQYLETMSPPCNATQSRLPLWHLSQTSQELRCAQGSLQIKVMSSAGGGGPRRQMQEWLTPAKLILSITCLSGHWRPASCVSHVLGSDQVSKSSACYMNPLAQSVQGRHVLHSLVCKVFRTWQIANPQVSFKTSSFSQHSTKYLTHNQKYLFLSSQTPFLTYPSMSASWSPPVQKQPKFPQSNSSLNQRGTSPHAWSL